MARWFLYRKSTTHTKTNVDGSVTVTEEIVEVPVLGVAAAVVVVAATGAVAVATLPVASSAVAAVAGAKVASAILPAIAIV